MAWPSLRAVAWQLSACSSDVPVTTVVITCTTSFSVCCGESSSSTLRAREAPL